MNTKTSRPNFPFLHGGGEMGEQVRNFDWSKTPLGTPDRWAQSLRTSVSILLNSQFPMFVWWGEELTTIYNDSYKIIAGDKHPALLGKSGREAWSEIWDDLSVLVDHVFKGNSTWSEDMLLHINRHGFIEETYFTFSYSPVLDESGSVGGLFCAVIETTDKVVSKKKIEESERNLRNTILQSPVAMCILKGPDNIVQIANERIIKLWGAEGRNVIGKSIFESVPEVAGQGFESLLSHVFLTGESYKAFSVPLTIANGNGGLQTIYIDFVYEAYREADKSISGILAIAIDVTEQVVARKKIEESEAELQKRVEERTRELANANEELKRSNQNLQEFAYAASHDMKEPIRKIHFFGDRLRATLEGSLSPEQGHYFNRMLTAANRMSTLIDDLLLYSNISRGANLQEDVDLNELTATVLEDLELERDDKKAHISVGHLPVIKGHKRQLQQLFQNLIGNSLKYSKPGMTPRISIECDEVTGKQLPHSLSHENGEKLYYRIRFQDNGIGFDQTDAGRIFNVFTRLHGNAEYRGTGVGLSIARKVVDNHHGLIEAESKPGEGAIFNVYLPHI